MGAAELNTVLIFNPVPDNAAAAVIARGSKGVDRAFETVEYMTGPTESYFKRLVIRIPAYFARRHCLSSSAATFSLMQICAAPWLLPCGLETNR
jgi:hypothetical protein